MPLRHCALASLFYFPPRLRIMLRIMP